MSADYDAFLDRELEDYYAEQEREERGDDDYDGPDPDDLPEPPDDSYWSWAARNWMPGDPRFRDHD